MHGVQAARDSWEEVSMGLGFRCSIINLRAPAACTSVHSVVYDMFCCTSCVFKSPSPMAAEPSTYDMQQNMLYATCSAPGSAGSNGHCQTLLSKLLSTLFLHSI